MLEFALGVGWTVAALFAGLWWGERGRRKTTENWAVRGHPDDEAKAEVHDPDITAETANRDTGSPAHSGYQRLVREIKQEAGVSEDQAKAHADELLGSSV